MAARTIYLSKLLGFFCIAFALCTLTHRQATGEIMASMLRAPAVLFLGSLFTLVGGLAMVLAHNRWSGGPGVVIVTICGWAALVKALLSLYSPWWAQTALKMVSNAALYISYMVFLLLLGVYLTVSGFRSKPQS